MGEQTTQNLPNDILRLILARLDSIDTRLTALEEKVERRLQETRPIWEQVLTRLDGIDSRLTNVETRLVAVETRLGGVEKEVYGLNRKFRVFYSDMMKLQDGYEDLEERVRKLDSQPT